MRPPTQAKFRSPTQLGLKSSSNTQIPSISGSDLYIKSKAQLKPKLKKTSLNVFLQYENTTIFSTHNNGKKLIQNIKE